MKFLKWLLDGPQPSEEEKISDKALTRSVFVSVVGILVCMVCLFGASWAWFSDSVDTEQIAITSANFDVTVAYKVGGNVVEIIKGADGYYTLDSGKTYSITLTNVGTATKGFCHVMLVKNGETAATVYYTSDITTGSPITFTLSQTAKIKFTPMWGTRPSEATIIQNGSVIGSKTN